MRQRFAILAAACSLTAVGLLGSPAIGQLAHPPAPPAKQTAGGQADIPVRQVVLFNSGVGYFEHFGSVKGDAATELRFKTDQINDVLKSLLLQDMDGGKVGTVSYPGQAPLAHTLKSFQVDITDNPNMADLLNQLRGAKITVSLAGANKVSGTILGVEKKVRPGTDRSAPSETSVLNLKFGRTFRSIPLDEVQQMELEDPKLEKELDEALSAVEQAHDQDKKPMTLHFLGAGERRVRIGYVVETPIWKTSYRLVLGDENMFGNPGGGIEPKGPVFGNGGNAHRIAFVSDASGPTTKDDADKKPNAGAREKDAPATKPAHPATHPAIADAEHISAKLQGWALVDNQTDNDWTDVQLSLVSGRPLSFIQDLYHSLYLHRPVIQPDLVASLFPQTYSGGIAPSDMEKEADGGGGNGLFSGGAEKGAGGGGGGGGGGLFNEGGMKDRRGISQAPIDPTSSVISAASGAQVGELFQYTIGSVSLGRQKSAMIPIVTDDIEAERLSIYNIGVLADHPLLGARVKNTTKKYLLQGPITVLDHGTYAGDARIEDIPPGQERFISYGIDQQVLVALSDDSQESTTVTASLVKGVLHLTSKHVHDLTYIADNKSDSVKTLIIEHAREGAFKLTSPKEADEVTPIHYRFRRILSPHKTTRLTVVTEMTDMSLVQTVPARPDEIALYLKNAAIPQKVRDALAKAMQMKSDVLTLNSEIADRVRSISDVTSEQSRIRDNMKTVSMDTDYYKRLVKKLDEQETAIEKTQKQIAEDRKASEALSKQLADYLANLTVE